MNEYKHFLMRLSTYYRTLTITAKHPAKTNSKSFSTVISLKTEAWAKFNIK